jgi:hypothetical protein
MSIVAILFAEINLIFGRIGNRLDCRDIDIANI